MKEGWIRGRANRSNFFVNTVCVDEKTKDVTCCLELN